MYSELTYSIDSPKNHKTSVSCGDHTASQCRECTQGQSKEHSQWCSGQCGWQDGSCKNKLNKAHNTHNRKAMPLGDLGYGLHSQCVLEETTNTVQDTAPFVPDVATMRLKLDDNSKVVAFSLLGQILICERACYRTQVKDIAICLEMTAEQSMMFTNEMKIKTSLNDQVQNELSSNSLQHLQLAVDASASGILHQIFKIKRKSIYKSFRTFETSGLAEVLPTAPRTGYATIP